LIHIDQNESLNHKRWLPPYSDSCT